MYILLGVVLVPLFVGNRWLSLVGLSAQGLLLAAIAHGLAGAEADLRLLDLAVVRGLCVPVALGAAYRHRPASERNDLIPPSILWWTVVGIGMLGAFDFADAMVPSSGAPRTLVAVATALLLAGFLMLATQSAPFTQMIGVFHLDNAIALFELGTAPRHHPPGLLAAQTALLLLAALLCRWYLSAPDAGPDAPGDVPTL